MKIFIFALGFIMTTAMADGVDQRQILPLNEMQRNHLLGEMRMLLTGTGAILEALAQDDSAAVARHARSLGVEMPHKMEGHMDKILPEQFMLMGMTMHQDFDRIAQDAESGKDTKHTLQQLSKALGRCTACHAIYQIGTVQQSGEQGAQDVHGKHGAHSHTR
ncbi:hypothetical protein SAMN05216317_1013 [Nitrosomonas eutropha]|uniref:hypothetical protein n=1 Tax=Nitrosomonas TaxID=914 RepID=UPI000880FF5A|nr:MULTISPECIES: hypothetical protein [Nitrosomonas]SCX09325.1 hypothetical protein SAMN05216379_105103 [Nitrosomonas eutropha]SDV99285.1 hypothetical protein SAMN05216317_1013 [Nitrosomonas eutropha]